MIAELLILTGFLAGSIVNVSVKPQAQAVARKLINLSLAQIPSVISAGKSLASRAISALPQSAPEAAPTLEAEELEGIAEEATGRKVAADLLVEMSNGKTAKASAKAIK